MLHPSAATPRRIAQCRKPLWPIRPMTGSSCSLPPRSTRTRKSSRCTSRSSRRRRSASKSSKPFATSSGRGANRRPRSSRRSSRRARRRPSRSARSSGASSGTPARGWASSTCARAAVPAARPSLPLPNRDLHAIRLQRAPSALCASLFQSQRAVAALQERCSRSWRALSALQRRTARSERALRALQEWMACAQRAVSALQSWKAQTQGAPGALREREVRSPGAASALQRRALEICDQGHRTVVDQLHFHVGAEASGLDLETALAEVLHQGLDERGGFVGRRGAIEGGAPAALDRAGEGELRDDQEGRSEEHTSELQSLA